MNNILLLVFSVMLGLLSGEIIVRLLSPRQLIIPCAEIWRPDHRLGWRHRENIDVVINTGEGDVNFTTDENGYRISSRNEREEPSSPDIKILAIGDSFVEGLSVENESTISEIIKDSLSSKLNKTVEVLNAGVGGWTPNQYHLATRIFLEEGKCDLGLIFLYVGNDIVGAEIEDFIPIQIAKRHRFEIPGSLKLDSIKFSVLYPINDFLETRSHLYTLIKNRSKTALMKLGLAPDYFPEIFNLAEKSSKSWGVTANICEKIEVEFRRHDIPVVFVLLPASYQVYRDDFAQYVAGFNIPVESVDLDQPNTLLKQEFEKHSLELIDPLEHLRQKAKEGDSRIYGLVDKHFNQAGYKIAGEYIASSIVTVLSPVPQVTDGY